MINLNKLGRIKNIIIKWSYSKTVGLFLRLKILYRRLTGRCINCGKKIVQSCPDDDEICLECWMNITLHGKTEEGIV